MRSSFTTVLFCLLVLSAAAQSFTDSNLPIVLIQTDIDPATGLPAEIPDDPKVLGSMKVIRRPNGARNYVTDANTAAYLEYNGRIGIEIRGSTSQVLPKKPYSLTTLEADNESNNNVEIFGMPEENDWVLNAGAFEPTLIRDWLSYDLSRAMGNYAARGHYCEVVVNGDYQGVYVFMEKIKVDSDRVNILKMTAADIAAPNVTGGYITKADKTTGGDPVAWTMPSHEGDIIEFIHEHPKPEDVTPAQHAYILGRFSGLRGVMANQNTSIVNGYPTIIDVPSFVDFMISNELASNVDGYKFSTFFHKDRNGKLRAGPIWDFNLTYGNDLFLWGADRSHFDVWQFDNGDNTGPEFWKDLFDNPTFHCYLSKRWKALTATGQPLHYASIAAKIDSIALLLAEPIVREEARWGTIGNHADHVQSLKNWLQLRMAWLNAAWSNDIACANPAVPPLVISKIHYHPADGQGWDDDQLEFIEISNNSNQTRYLTGFYFSELGMSYVFPSGSTLGAFQSLYLASDAQVFQAVHGFAPFGQFTRNLSNKSQRLVLSDAFGNEIDRVEYADSAPWPTAADGDGPYLQLIDWNADNSLAQSWIPADAVLTSTADVRPADHMVLFPNPVRDWLVATSPGAPITGYTLSDAMGRQVLSANVPATEDLALSVAALPANVYFLTLTFEQGQRLTRKVIKH